MLNGLMDIVYGLICLAQLYLCLSWAYHSVFEPMASAPGSRDGAGLLIVGPVVLGGAMLVWAFLAGATGKFVQAIFPNWEPVLFSRP